MAIFLGAVAWCSALISWHSFADPDAFYHAKMALLIWQHGPVRSFPWLDLTTLGTAFADQHFLFHVIESPFVVMFGMANGARVTAILLASLFIAMSYVCLRWMKIRYAEWWTLLIALTGPLLVRMLLGKATPWAITLFVVGLVATWKRKPWIVFLVALVFALSHDGWVFLIGSMGLLAMGEVVFDIVVEEKKIVASMCSSPWREILVAMGGVVLGTLIHPNFPQNLSLFWIQVIQIGLGTPYAHVVLGSEWLPMSGLELLGGLAPWSIALMLGLLGFAFARKKPFEIKNAKAVVAFALPVAALVALTLKSRRNVEYLVPTLLLWIPWIWMLMEPRQLFEVMRESFAPRWRTVVVGFVGVALAAMLAKSAWDARVALHRDVYPDDVYRAAMAPVVAKAHPGDRVFHSDWDEFPMLFSIDDRLRYVAGLDPTFLYEASSTLSDAYRNVTWGVTTTTKEQAWSLIHDQLRARFVFIDPRDHPALLGVIKGDERYIPLEETPEGVTFELKD